MNCSVRKVEEIASRELHVRRFSWPSHDLKEDFAHKIKTILQRLKKQDPTHFYHVISKYSFKFLMKKNFYYHFRLGSVKVLRGLRCDCASLLVSKASDFFSHTQSFVSSPNNVYSLLKMLSFERKLKAIESLTPADRALLKRAILSDLLDEQFVFSIDTWTGEWNENKFYSELKIINTFIQWNWTDILSDEPNVQWVMDLILQFQAFIKVLPHWYDHLCWNRRHKIMATTVEKMIRRFLEQTLRQDPSVWQPLYQKYKTAFASMHLPALWHCLRFPIKDHGLQNNAVGGDSVIPHEEWQAYISEVRSYNSMRFRENFFETSEEREDAFKELECKFTEVSNR